MNNKIKYFLLKFNWNVTYLFAIILIFNTIIILV